MAEAITPNLNLVKPEIGGSQSTWGNRWNGNADKIDTAVGDNRTKANNALKKDSADPLERTAKQLLLYDSTVVITESDSKALMSREMVAALTNLILPIGTVIMWAGAVADIPAGWALCNGQTVNTNVTPNLVNRFILAAGGTYAPGVLGGVSSLSVSIRSEPIALTQSQMPAHNHAIYDPTHTHAASDAGHVHGTNAGGPSTQGFGDTGGRVTAYAGTNTSVGVASITVGYGATNIQTYNAGSSGAHDHGVAFSLPAASFYPLYYALCYIMRVKLA